MNVVMADESSDGRYFAMAGFIAETEVWSSFNRLWNAMLAKHGVDHLHMKFFTGAREQFKGWDEPRRRALMSDLLEVITAGPLTAIGACLKLSDFEALRPRMPEHGINEPYMATFHEMILGAGLMGATSDYPLTRIDMVYSQQDEYSSKMRLLWEFSKGYRGRRLESCQPDQSKRASSRTAVRPVSRIGNT